MPPPRTSTNLHDQFRERRFKMWLFSYVVKPSKNRQLLSMRSNGSDEPRATKMWWRPAPVMSVTAGGVVSTKKGSMNELEEADSVVGEQVPDVRVGQTVWEVCHLRKKRGNNYLVQVWQASVCRIDEQRIWIED